MSELKHFEILNNYHSDVNISIMHIVKLFSQYLYKKIIITPFESLYPWAGVSFLQAPIMVPFLEAIFFLSPDALPDAIPLVAFDPAGIITSILVLILPTFGRMTGWVNPPDVNSASSGTWTQDPEDPKPPP